MKAHATFPNFEKLQGIVNNCTEIIEKEIENPRSDKDTKRCVEKECVPLIFCQRDLFLFYEIRYQCVCNKKPKNIDKTIVADLKKAKIKKNRVDVVDVHHFILLVFPLLQLFLLQSLFQLLLLQKLQCLLFLFLQQF